MLESASSGGLNLSGEQISHDFLSDMAVKNLASLEPQGITQAIYEPSTFPGHILMANASFISYVAKSRKELVKTKIRVLSHSNAETLIKVHTQAVCDISFLEVDGLGGVYCASIAVDGSLHVCYLEEVDSEIFLKTLLQVLPWEQSGNFGENFLLAWHPTDPDILAVTGGNINEEVYLISISEAVQFHESDVQIEAPTFWSGAGVTVLQGHTETITDLTFSPDGTCLTSCSGDGNLFIWSTQEKLIVRHMNPFNFNPISSVAFLNSESRFAPLLVCGGDDDHSIKVWNTASWDLIQTIQFPQGSSKFRLNHPKNSPFVFLTAQDSFFVLHAKIPSVPSDSRFTQLKFMSYSSEASLDYQGAGFDFITQFSLGNPIYSFFVCPLEPGLDGKSRIYCVHPNSIDFYDLDHAHCYPSDRASLPTIKEIDQGPHSRHSEGFSSKKPQELSFEELEGKSRDEEEELARQREAEAESLLKQERERILAQEREAEAEKQRQEQELERQEKERQEKERQEKERQEKERQEKERQEKERQEKERQEREDLERKELEGQEQEHQQEQASQEQEKQRQENENEHEKEVTLVSSADEPKGEDHDFEMVNLPSKSEGASESFRQSDDDSIPTEVFDPQAELEAAGVPSKKIPVKEKKPRVPKKKEEGAPKAKKADGSLRPKAAEPKVGKLLSFDEAPSEEVQSPLDEAPSASSSSSQLAYALQSPIAGGAFPSQFFDPPVLISKDSSHPAILERLGLILKRQEELHDSLLNQRRGFEASASQAVERILQKEMRPVIASSKHPQKVNLDPALLAKIEKVVYDSVGKISSQDGSLDAYLRPMVPQLQKAILENLTTSFRSQLLPTFEKASAGLFQQTYALFQQGLDQAFRTLSQEVHKDTSELAAIQSKIEQSFRAANPTPAQIQQILEPQLAQINDAINRMERSLRSTSIQPPNAEAPQSIEDRVFELLSKKNIEGAFCEALSASDLSLVLKVCSQQQISDVFTDSPQLSPPTLLSLLQQLSMSIEDQTGLKLLWINESLLAFEDQDNSLAEHIPDVKEQLIEAMKTVVTQFSNEPAFLNQARVILRLAQKMG